MPMLQVDKHRLARDASPSTIRRLRTFYRGDFHALTEIDKTLGINDECVTPIGPKYSSYTGPENGCPLSFASFLFGLYVLAEFGVKVFSG